jgi:hypothetical protein
MVTYFVSITNEKDIGWAAPSDDSGKIFRYTRLWACHPQDSTPTYDQAEHFLQFLDKYVSRAIGSHLFLQWSKSDKLKCKDCQKHKLACHGYGLLPKQEVQISPWEEVAIHLIGPWKVKVNGQQVEFNALTCIDMASNLVKLNHVDNKTAKHIHDKFT